MQKLFVFLLLAYFSLGTLLLPQGDFSTLPDMPKMYAHCRDTEDKDLNVFEFVTEHLLALDVLSGDMPEQDDLPHQPVQFHHLYTPVVAEIKTSTSMAHKPLRAEKKTVIIIDDNYLSDYPASVFRPPIV